MAAPAYADTYGKIYSLVSSPANCMQGSNLFNNDHNFLYQAFTDGCSSWDSQQWSYYTGNQTISNGMYGGGRWCLDVEYGNTANGSPVALFPCNGDDPAQKWVVVGQSLVNPQSGRCLDDPNGATRVQLQLWDCNIGGNANQNWDIVGYQ
jgi:hypothetical protein